jgi:hypothetical protein
VLESCAYSTVLLYGFLVSDGGISTVSDDGISTVKIRD